MPEMVIRIRRSHAVFVYQQKGRSGPGYTGKVNPQQALQKRNRQGPLLNRSKENRQRMKMCPDPEVAVTICMDLKRR